MLLFGVFVMMEMLCKGDYGYEYDVVVIGGGFGGFVVVKEVVKYGVKMMCLDFVKLSLAGTMWGFGGMCVNVGCILKKFMY